MRIFIIKKILKNINISKPKNYYNQYDGKKMKDEDKEILDELRNIQKNKKNWKNNIDNVANYLNENYSVEVNAKALWAIGEMGLIYPAEVEKYVDEIAAYLENDHSKLRERSVNALGRIGRADKKLVIPYFNKLMKTRDDDSENVRLSFVWACENIATNAPELFLDKLEIFFEMISDSGEKVRIEAPEMFRVIGKRKPEYVNPYLEKLEYIAENDEHPVVRIHCEGAIRITKKIIEKKNKI